MAGVGVGSVRGVGVGAGVGLGFGVGFGVVTGEGLGGGGAVIVTLPPSIVSVKRRVSAASKLIVWVPTESVVDQVWRTPCFQLVPLPVIRCAVPSTITFTWSAAEPSRLR